MKNAVRYHDIKVMNGKKKRPAWLKLVEERAITDTFDNFVVKESSLRAWNTNSNQWDLEIGKGLFTKYSFDCNEDIIQFNGEYIPKIRVDEIRNEALQGSNEWRYVIASDEDSLYLNCYEKYKKGLCYASYANDFRNCVIAGTLELPTCNAELVVHPLSKRFILRATKLLKKARNYGTEFFPTQSSESYSTQGNSSDSSWTQVQISPFSYLLFLTFND